MAEDARIITVKKIDEERLAAERQAGAARESRAENGRAVAQSETERVTREAEPSRIKRRARSRPGEAGQRRDKAGSPDRSRPLEARNDAQTLAAQTEADRLKQDNDAKMAAAAN